MGFAHDFGASADLLPSYCEIRGIDPEQGIEGVREDIRLLSHQGRMRVLWECGQKAGILASDIGIEHMDRSFSLFTGITRGIQNYTVQPYPDPIILFRAADEPNPQTDDPTLGWARHASDIKVYDVPGAHFTMLTQPHVRILAEKIKSCIE